MGAVTDFLAFAIAGALMIAGGVPLYRGRVGPTALYGGRLPRALRDRAAWTYATRAVGRALIVGGAAVVVFSVAGAALGVTLEDELPMLLILGLLVGSIAFGVVQALSVMRRRR
jgi:uncharacterized membrane protein